MQPFFISFAANGMKNGCVLKIFGRMHKFVESFCRYAVPLFSGLVLIGHKNLNTVTLIKVCGQCLISVTTEEKSKQSVALKEY